jgi:hypothetical protein
VAPSFLNFAKSISKQLEEHERVVGDTIEEFMSLRDEIKEELSTLPYKTQARFPHILRSSRPIPSTRSPDDA